MSIIPGYLYTDNKYWYEYENYWLYSAPQKSEEWLKIRKGRISGSTVCENIGDSQYCNQEEAVLYTCGIKQKEFSEFSKNAMAHGVKYEPIARKVYEDNFLKPKNLFVIEVGFLIPKWNEYIGFSPDGLIFSNNDKYNPIGIIEIKCPQKMYKDLDIVPFNDNYIKKEHYQQMQLGMAVTKTKFCVYVVLDTNYMKLFTQYINFNENYWNYMKGKMENVIEYMIKPKLNFSEFISLKKIKK